MEGKLLSLPTATIAMTVFLLLSFNALLPVGSGFARGSVYHNPAKVDHRRTEKNLLDDILSNRTYDRKIRPSNLKRQEGSKDSTKVKINMMIRSINKIDDYNMEFSIQMTFREQWKDDRLGYSSLKGEINYLTLTETDKIWMPDLFFKNEKMGHFHNIILPNTYIRISPNGMVLYSIRISLTLSCPMNLKLYPLDTQKCELRMASYGWTTEDLVFEWEPNDPVQVTKNLHLPRFILKNFLPGDCSSVTNTGEYSCLRVDLYFKREFSYYLIQYYLPCCMLVIVSWVSFWLDQYSVPARVALGVTTLLTMSTQNAGINQSLPPVSYTKAIDVWTGACLTFVFGALLEFALVNYACRDDVEGEMQMKRSARWHQASGNMRYRKYDQEASNSYSEYGIDDIDERQNSYSFSNSASKTPKLCGIPFLDGTACDAADSCCASTAKNASANHTSAAASVDGTIHPCEVHLRHPMRFNPFSIWSSKFSNRGKRIDVLARIIFPLLFALFNLVYWLTYLRGENDFDG